MRPSMISSLRWVRLLNRPMFHQRGAQYSAISTPLSQSVRARVLAASRAAYRVSQHAHVNAGTGPLGERLNEAVLHFAFAPDECFEVNALGRGGNVVEHRGQRRAVLMHAGLVPVVHGALGQPREHRQRVLDRRELFESQLQKRRATPTRQHERHSDREGGRRHGENDGSDVFQWR